MLQTRVIKHLYRVTLTVVIWSAAAIAWASPATELTALLQKMQSASGEFQQTLSDPRGKTLQASQGQFAVSKPGKFLWHTLAPYPQQLVSNGQLLWLYDPDLEQASVTVVSDKMGQTPAVLLSGEADQIERKFAVTNIAPAGQEPLFELTSKAPDADFSGIRAAFKDGVLASMTLVDKSGNVTQFSFSKVLMNPVLSAEQFEFTPPEGTDIIRND
jgi:outer membrane lipoprotein carrier protein